MKKSIIVLLIFIFPFTAFAQTAEEYLEQGRDKRSSGDYRGAIQDYNKAIMLDPDNDFAYSRRGYNKSKLGDYRGAIQDINKIIMLKPDYADAYNNRGIAKSNLNDYRGAIQDYDKAIMLKPDYADAYNNRGLVFIQLEKKDKGCLDLSKAGELGKIGAYELIKKYCN